MRGIALAAMAALLAVLVLAAAWPGQGWACACPKEQMIKKYGTVSQFPPPLPVPPTKPALPSGGNG